MMNWENIYDTYGIVEYTIFDNIAIVVYEDGHREHMSVEELNSKLNGR